jgi:hypothetical protein
MTDDTSLNATKLAVLREALDVGVAELDAGLGVESSIDDLIAEVCLEAALEA